MSHNALTAALRGSPTWRVRGLPFAAAGLLAAACGSAEQTPTAVDDEPPAAPATFDPSDCENGDGGLHSDYINGLDTPEAAAARIVREPEVPDGDIVVASESARRVVFSIVDETGRPVGEVTAEPFGDSDTWVAYDAVWCR